MSAVKTNCSLCRKKDVLFTYSFISMHIQKSFFIVNKKLFAQDYVDKLQLCITCIYKIELSAAIIREYEEMCNRNHIMSNKKCFFCEAKAEQLIDLNESLNGVQEQITTFLNSVTIKHSYNDKTACLKCLYCLNIWNEVRQKLYKAMGISDSSLTTNNNSRRASTPDIPKSRRSRSANLLERSASDSTITSRKATKKNLFEQSPKRQVNTPTTAVPDKRNKHTSNHVAPRRNNAVSKRIGPASRRARRNNKTMSWCNYLKDKFKNIKTVNQLTQDGNLTLPASSTIEYEKDKLFTAVPYVDLVISSQISKELILQSDVAIPTIIISDTEEDTRSTTKRSNRRLNLSLKKQTPTTSAEKRKQTNKRTFKIKFPARPLSKQRSRIEDLKNVTVHSSDSEDATQAPSSSDAKHKEELQCNVCDKIFTVKCEYLSHKLKHEKLDNLVVNVSRNLLPEQLNVGELSPQPELKKALNSPKDISRLLNKYVGKRAASLFENSTVEDSDTVEHTDDNEKTVEGDSAAIDVLEQASEGMEFQCTSKPDEEGVDKTVEHPDSSATVQENETDTVSPESVDETENVNCGFDSDNCTASINEDAINSSVSSEERKEDEENSKGNNEEVENYEEKTNKEDEDKEEEMIKEDEKEKEDKGNKEIEEDSEEEEENKEKQNDKEEEGNKEHEKNAESEQEDKDQEHLEQESTSVEKLPQSNKDVKTSVGICNNSDVEVECIDQFNDETEKEIESLNISHCLETLNDEHEKETEFIEINQSTSSETEEQEIVDATSGNLKKEDDTVEVKTESSELNRPHEESPNVDGDSKTVENQTASDSNVEASDQREELKEEQKIDKSNLASATMMSCEELLNILETNVDSETDDAILDLNSPTPGKRKRAATDDSDVTPKRKKVRFAEEKEIFTSDKTGVQVERLIVNEQVVLEDEEASEEESETLM